MNDLIRVTYSPEKNQTYVKKESGLIELEGFFRAQKVCRYLLKEVKSIHEEGIYLDTFLAYCRNAWVLSKDASEMLSLIAYPSKGKVEEYVLNQEGLFFSNAHRNPDPMIINSIRVGFHIHRNITDDFLQICSGGVPNRIRGAIFFKRNPFVDLGCYEGFQEFIEGKETYLEHW